MNFVNVKKIQSKKTGKMYLIFEGDVNLDMKAKTVTHETFPVGEDHPSYARLLKLTGL